MAREFVGREIGGLSHSVASPKCTGLGRAVVCAILGAILLAVFSVTANAACPGPLPKTLTNNTTANADDVMANFNHLLNNCGGSAGTNPWVPSGSSISYTGGAVGIGTTTPGSGYLLDVNGSLHVNGSITCNPACGGGGGGSWSTSATNYTTGSLGVGTGSPTSRLTVVAGTNGGYDGILLYPNNQTQYMQFGYQGIMSSNHFNIAAGGNNGDGFSVNTNQLVVLQSSGNVGIGTMTPSYTLHVNGTAYATGAAGALSDIRDKKDIAPLSMTALDAISKLRPVTFVWKEAKDDGMKGRQMGLIAQEVEKVLPSAILTASDKRKSKAIKYNELTAILIKAVQEQQKEIADQAKLMNLQASEIRQLQSANKKLEASLIRIERVHQARVN